MELLRNGRPRVVITGLGAMTALGPVRELWDSLVNGRSGIRRITTIPIDHVPVQIGAEVRDFDPAAYGIDRKEARRMGRACGLVVAAARQAVEDAGLTTEQIETEGERVATVVGSTLGSHELSEQMTTKYAADRKKPNPFGLVNSLPNMPSHYVSKFFRALGPLMTTCTACAAGTQAVGEASELIKNGRADMVITGGVEAVLQDYTIAGFSAMEAIASDFNDDPEKASRPFDKTRSGFVVGEGAGIVILESLAHALKRSAHIYAEVIGHASSSDAYHVAALDPTAMGATRVMRWAVEDAKIPYESIGYINAHGTSTQANDAMETFAIKKAFGEQAYNLMISSTKSMIGHALGAAGAIEIIASVKTLVDQVIHPTINYETPDPDCDLDYTPNIARQVKNLRYVMSNSFGLGGQNASIVLAKI